MDHNIQKSSVAKVVKNFVAIQYIATKTLFFCRDMLYRDKKYLYLSQYFEIVAI